jgi:hypothetical protein
MPDDRLVRHFLTQFVENDFAPDSDRHQTLAVTAAAVITIPLFVTVFMSVKYLLHPLQASGWTETTLMGDEVTFCAASLLVAAVVALLQWDALALNARDAAILGVLPIPRRAVVRAKLTALVTFAAAFSVALNAIPSLLHPLLMSAQLPMSPLMLVPLSAVHAMSTVTAALFGFAAVLVIRESLFALMGPTEFHRFSNRIRSLLLFAVLLMLALVPVRLSDSAAWMFEPGPAHVLLEPVGWFAAGHAAVAGRMLDGLPRPDMPPRMKAEEIRLTSRYRAALPRLTREAAQGAVVVLLTVLLAIVLYLRNARRIHVLIDGPQRSSVRLSRAPPIVTWRSAATRAGFRFGLQTLIGSSVHRVYMLVALAAGIALFIALSPGPVRTVTLAAQTLLIAAVVAGFRASVRTSADYRALWIFDVTDTGRADRFRAGVRLCGMLLMGTTVAVLYPVAHFEWGWRLAAAHAVDGLAIGWLLVEAATAGVERPFVVSIPPSDGVNTVGVVLGGAALTAVFVAAHIERSTIFSPAGVVAYPLACAAIACAIRVSGTRRYRHPEFETPR